MGEVHFFWLNSLEKRERVHKIGVSFYGHHMKNLFLSSEQNFNFQRSFVRTGSHIMPLYFIPVSVSLRLARTLLKRLLSKS